MDGKMVIKKREGILNQVYIATSSDICYVYLLASIGDMWKPHKCYCTILVELKSTKERNSLDKMEKYLFTKRRGGGGIDFHMIHEFNQALLEKQFWRLVQYPNLLVARVLSKTYYIMSSPLRTSSASSPSYAWTNISAARKLLLLKIRQKIHSGYEAKVWEDP